MFFHRRSVLICAAHVNNTRLTERWVGGRYSNLSKPSGYQPGCTSAIMFVYNLENIQVKGRMAHLAAAVIVEIRNVVERIQMVVEGGRGCRKNRRNTCHN